MFLFAETVHKLVCPLLSDTEGGYVAIRQPRAVVLTEGIALDDERRFRVEIFLFQGWVNGHI